MAQPDYAVEWLPRMSATAVRYSDQVSEVKLLKLLQRFLALFPLVSSLGNRLLVLKG